MGKLRTTWCQCALFLVVSRTRRTLPFLQKEKGAAPPPPPSFLAGNKSSSRLPHAAAVVDQSLNEEEEELQFRRLSRTFSEGIFEGKDSPSGFRMKRGRKNEEEGEPIILFFPLKKLRLDPSCDGHYVTGLFIPLYLSICRFLVIFLC